MSWLFGKKKEPTLRETWSGVFKEGSNLIKTIREVRQDREVCDSFKSGLNGFGDDVRELVKEVQKLFQSGKTSRKK